MGGSHEIHQRFDTEERVANTEPGRGNRELSVVCSNPDVRTE